MTSSSSCLFARMHRASILFQNTASTDLLPLTNTPEVFGLHPNAEINYYSQTTREIWSHLIELQPQTGKCVCVYVYFVHFAIGESTRDRFYALVKNNITKIDENFARRTFF